jgi:hypothetical protein
MQQNWNMAFDLFVFLYLVWSVRLFFSSVCLSLSIMQGGQTGKEFGADTVF